MIPEKPILLRGRGGWTGHRIVTDIIMVWLLALWGWVRPRL